MSFLRRTRKEATLLSEADDALREEQMNDPKVQARIKRIFEDARNGDSGPGITEEELPDFLREQRS